MLAQNLVIFPDIPDITIFLCVRAHAHTRMRLCAHI